MRIIELVLAASRFSPEVPLRSKLLSLNLKKMDTAADEKRYIGGSLLISICFGICSSFIAILLGENLAFGLISFALAFAFFLYLPSMEVRRRSAEFESRLPMVLRTISMLLEMRIPFQKSIEIASQSEPELRPVVEDMNRGVTVEKSFARLATLHDSLIVKRALSQLLSAYEIGSSGREVARIGDELLSVQRHALREHSSRSAMFGLVFVVCAAVLPTFFLVYSVLNQLTAGPVADRIAIAVAMLLIFPLISLGILLVARSMLPRSALDSGSGTIDLGVLGGAGVMVLSFLILPQSYSMIGIVIGLAIAGMFVYKRYAEEKRVEELERHLPDALFAVSGLPKSTKMEDIFGAIERQGYGPLSEEASKSRKQLTSNLGIQLVLNDLAQRNSSRMMKRVSEMLGHVFSTNSFDKLNVLAEDITKFVEIKRERAGLLSMQKYTLVFGGFLVPVILKITLNLLSSMAEFFSTGANPQIEFAFSLVPAYLVMYGLLSYFYISGIEENRASPALNFMIIVVGGMAAFFLLNI